MSDVVAEINSLFVLFDIESRVVETDREGYLYAIHSIYESNIGGRFLTRYPAWLFKDEERLRKIADLIIKEQTLGLG